MPGGRTSTSPLSIMHACTQLSDIRSAEHPRLARSPFSFSGSATPFCHLLLLLLPLLCARGAASHPEPRQSFRSLALRLTPLLLASHLSLPLQTFCRAASRSDHLATSILFCLLSLVFRSPLFATGSVLQLQRPSQVAANDVNDSTRLGLRSSGSRPARLLLFCLPFLLPDPSFSPDLAVRPYPPSKW